MSATPLEIVTALQVLADSTLSIARIAALLQQPDVTEADVQAQLDATDDAIEQARTDN